MKIKYDICAQLLTLLVLHQVENHNHLSASDWKIPHSVCLILASSLACHVWFLRNLLTFEKYTSKPSTSFVDRQKISQIWVSLCSLSDHERGAQTYLKSPILESVLSPQDWRIWAKIQSDLVLMRNESSVMLASLKRGPSWCNDSP